jgi:hypothetical protein
MAVDWAIERCRHIVLSAFLEVRSSQKGNRIGTVVFFIHEGQMVLLHGFFKRTQRLLEAEYQACTCTRYGLKEQPNPKSRDKTDDRKKTRCPHDLVSQFRSKCGNNRVA